MAYLNNEIIEIEAILTQKGRELLAKNNGKFNITKFALADDGIDYNLWNPDTTDDLKGFLIENSPVLEPNSNENNVMRNKLITLPIGTTRIPILSVGQTSLTLNAGQRYIITPTVVNYSNANETYGYTATIIDSSIAELKPYVSGQTTTYYSTSNVSGESVTVTGQQFELVGRSLTDAGTTSILIQGNETGGQIEIVLTVNKNI